MSSRGISKRNTQIYYFIYVLVKYIKYVWIIFTLKKRSEAISSEGKWMDVPGYNHVRKVKLASEELFSLIHISGFCVDM